jgi:hypothetical protein
MSSKKTPKMIDITSEELDGINARISTNTLLDDDKRIVLAILSAYTWIQCQLERHKLSIKRLKNMFGFSTERRGKHNQKEPENPPADPNNSGDDNESSDTKETPEVNPSKKPLSWTH